MFGGRLEPSADPTHRQKGADTELHRHLLRPHKLLPNRFRPGTPRPTSSSRIFQKDPENSIKPLHSWWVIGTPGEALQVEGTAHAKPLSGSALGTQETAKRSERFEE